MNGIKALSIALLFVLSLNLSAQVRNYTFQHSVGSYSLITGGSQYGTATVDDASFSDLSLGFNFVFNGQTFSKISINSNGYIAFGSSIIETYNPISNPYGSSNIVSALTYDLKGQSNGGLRAELLGSSPNRVYVVQWKNFKRYSFNSDSLDFQIRIYETLNKVEVIYGRCELSGYTNGVDNLFEVGLRGNSIHDFSNREIGNTYTWNNSRTGKTNGASCRINASNLPPSGLSYSWQKIVYQNDVSVNKIITTSGCGASSSENVSILIKNNGTQAQSQIIVGYIINTLTAIKDTFNSTLLPDSSIIFSFTQKADLSTFGDYSIIAWTALTTDSFADNDTFFGYAIFSAPGISDYPYVEDFESNDGYWHSRMITGNNPWQWGVPAQSKISSANSGSKVWMTSLATNYSDNSQSYLQSPCFDFTGFSQPQLSFYMRLETENKWDPMLLEASTDQGHSWKRVDSANTNFYNATNTGGPFDPPYFSGNNTSWTQYTGSLSDFGNEASVIFRYRFYADGSTNDEGIAIDDIEVFAQYDISMLGLYLPSDSICGDSMQEVWLIAENLGKSKAYNVPFRVKITGSTTQTISANKSILNVNQVDTFLIGTFNSNTGGIFNFQCYSRFGTDNRRGNDTIWESRYIFSGVPAGGKLVNYIHSKTNFNSGTYSDPDILCQQDTAFYEFQLPIGIYASGYGSSWSILNPWLNTKYDSVPSVFNFWYPGVLDSNLIFMIVANPVDADSLYEIHFTLQLSNGCSQYYTRHIKIGENIFPSFSVNNTCLGNASIFTNHSYANNSSITSWWDFGNGDTSIAANPSYTYNSSDTFSIELVATAASGCKKSYKSQTIIYEVPDVDFTFKNICQNNTAYFNNLTPSIADTINFYWDFGNGNFANSFHSNSAYDSGYYAIWLKGTTANGCADSITKMITVYPLPIADFTVKDICHGDTLFAQNLSSDVWNNPLSFFWTFDMNDTSSLGNPYFIPLTHGLFDLKLSALSDKNCSNSISKTVNVNAVPKADFSFFLPHLCLGDTLKILNNTTIASSDTLSFSWNFGLDDTSTAFIPLAIPDSIGVYNMQLVVNSNKQCSDTIAKGIQVYMKPHAEFSIVDEGICFGERLNFINSSFISTNDTLSYIWLFASSDTTRKKNPSYLPKMDGTIDILLATISNYGCVDTALQSALVFTLPDATFSSTLGSHGMVDFMPADTNLLSYLWYFGDGDSSTIKLANHTYKMDKEYMAKLLVRSNESCMNEDSSFIIITGAGIASLDYLIDIKVYPNPFKDYIEIEFSLQKQSQLSIQLYDLSGQLIYEGIQTNYNSGNYTEKLSLDELAAGFYFIRINGAENKTMFKGVMKMK